MKKKIILLPGMLSGFLLRGNNYTVLLTDVAQAANFETLESKVKYIGNRMFRMVL